jgi:hypothetical protein
MKYSISIILLFAVALPVFAQTQATIEAQATTGSDSSAGSDVTTEPQEASVDYFLKIDGVDGEAKAKGNVETEWKVEEGESAAPNSGEAMKESGEKGGTGDINIGVGELQGVSVNAVEVRGWDAEQKQEFLLTVKAHAELQSDQDLENFARGVLLEHEEIDEVSVDDTRIEVRHRGQGRLLGVIPVSFTRRVEINADADAESRVRVRMPWYSFLIRKGISATELETRIKADIELSRSETDWNFTHRAVLLERLAHLLEDGEVEASVEAEVGAE